MPHAADRLRTAERRAEVLRLRLAGLQFADIAAQLDPPVSKQRAHQLYRAALAEVVREPGEAVIKAELLRLDMLWRALLPQALRGSARHVEVAVRLLERRARMLGLDAPTRAEVHLTGEEVEALDTEIEALLAAAGHLEEPARGDLGAGAG
jgi:hypothetical protein